MLKKFVLVIVILIAFTSANISSAEVYKAINLITVKQQHEVSSLYNATIKQWRNATYANKLMTCAEYITAANEMNMLKFRVTNKNELIHCSQELVSFIDAAIKGVIGIDDHNVTEFVTLGFALMEWLKN